MEKVHKFQGLHQKRKIDTIHLVKIAFLSAIAYVIFLIEFPIPYFPPFLEIDFSDIVAILGGIMLGPLAAVFIEIIKNALRFVLFNSGTGGIGELANIIVGIAYVLPFCLIFRVNNLKRFILGSLAGITSMTLFASLANYFILIPVYTGINMHAEKMDMIIKLYGPFNIVKGVIITLVGYIAIKAFKQILPKFY
ncbi:ECF transporter S component [Vallitalea pronyensis]|uniref:Riboflavin transporter n=1 Tax=Vallitalea pronyensis TaxID=1348613 RepID=A0A8J8MNZ2_9FIRM|nr:ECF transporter S component [Vallitalea pronyensis]QUI24921.1 ECF transporter S component [Vallitalea pronyensis]